MLRASVLVFECFVFETTRLPYTNFSGHASDSNTVKNGHNTYNIPQATQQQQNFPPQHYNVQNFSPSHLAAVGPIPSVLSKTTVPLEKPRSWNPKGTGIFNPIF